VDKNILWRNAHIHTMKSKTHHQEFSDEKEQILKTQTLEKKEHSSDEIQTDQLTEGQDLLNSIKIPIELENPQNVFPSSQNIENPDIEIKKLKEQLLITQADFDNFRKRSARDQDDLRRFACAGIIAEILPILDSFEIGLKSTAIDQNMFSGFQMVFTQLKTILSNKGLEEVVTTAGTGFNPLQHEAVAYIHHQEIQPECVIEVVRKGYLFNDRLLRPVSVIVSKGKLLEENQNQSSGA
jgi:molecular chaperone GrpE